MEGEGEIGGKGIGEGRWEGEVGDGRGGEMGDGSKGGGRRRK